MTHAAESVWPIRKALAPALFVVVLAGGLHWGASPGAAAEPVCPGGSEADANVVFCEDFEDGTWLDDWSTSPYCCDIDGDGAILFAEREAVVCGARGFQDDCAAWTDEAGKGNHYGERFFTTAGYDELYARWYVYVSDPFRWDPVGDKNFKLQDATGTGPYIMLNMWATAKPHIVVYNNSLTPCVSQSAPNHHGEYPFCVNRSQNLNNDITLEPGKWYLFEWYVKLNEPGVPNGVTRLWVDEAVSGLAGQTLRAEYTDVVFRTAIHSGMLLKGVFLTPYHNTDGAPFTQHQKWDNIVISRAPIGPMPLLHEDFEAASTATGGRIGNWDRPANPSTMYVTDQASHSGGHSLELKYDPGSYGAGYMFRNFPGVQRVYHRWRQKWSSGFQWDPVGTGMAVLGRPNGYPWFAAQVPWGTGGLAVTAGVIAEAGWDTRHFYQNEGTAVVFQPDQWYCIEVLVQLNTPGVADGELAAWIDDELKLRYTDRQFRGAYPTDPAPATAVMETVMINGGHYGTPVPQLQFAWQDDHITSGTRIGCH